MPQTPKSADPAGSNVIELRAETVESLFEPFDPAPLEARSVSRAAEGYVVERYTDLEPGRQASIRVLLPAAESGLCTPVQQAFRRHFANAALRQQRQLRDYIREGWIMLFKSVLMALILVLAAQSLAASSESVVVNKLANGLSIVVWVVLWKPVERLLHEWRPLRSRRDIYRELAEISVDSRSIV